MPQHFHDLDFLSPYNRTKPRFTALAEAVLKQADDLFALPESMLSSCSLEGAVGPQLDAFGMLAGIPRQPNSSDEDYRFLLRARIAARRWNGTNETLPEILALAFPDRRATLADNQDGTVTAFLPGEAPPFPLLDLFPVPAGIRLTNP